MINLNPLAALLGKAATLTRKRAELASVDAVTFAKLYFTIGKAIAVVDKLPPELEALRSRIRSLEEQAASPVHASESSQNANKGKGFAGAVKVFVAKASKAAGDAAVSAQLTLAYTQLGKAAVDKYGDKAVPKAVKADFQAAGERRSKLTDEIESLEKSASYGLFTVKRVAIAGVCLAAVVVAWGARASLSWFTGHRPAAVARRSTTPGKAATRPQESTTVSGNWNDTSSRSARTADVAIKVALGDISSGFAGKSFSDIVLGSDYMALMGPGVQYDALPEAPYCLTSPPLATGNSTEDGRRETRVVVDADTNRIVGVVRNYIYTHRGELEDQIKSTFGTPLQSPSRQLELAGSSFRGIDVWCYTFPQVVVRVVSREQVDLRNGSERPSVTVWVFDRGCIEKDLRSFAIAVGATCSWIDQAKKVQRDSSFKPSRWPRLADTEFKADDSSVSAIYTDRMLSQQLAKALKEGADRVPMWVPPDDLIAAAAAGNDLVAFAAQPSQSASVQMTDFLVTGPPPGPCRLHSTPFKDLLQEVASVVCQSYFSPSGKSVTTIVEKEPFMARRTIDSPVPSKCRGLFYSTKGTRCEWVDSEGSIVRVSDSGRISVSKGSL